MLYALIPNIFTASSFKVDIKSLHLIYSTLTSSPDAKDSNAKSDFTLS